MKSWLVPLSILIAAASARAANRWPNVGPSKHKIASHEVVVITPTSEYSPPDYSHRIAPQDDNIFHSTYSTTERHYLPTHSSSTEFYYPTPQHYPTEIHYHLPEHHPPAPAKRPYFDEKTLRKKYEDYLDKTSAFKKNFVQKVIDKTIGAAAKVTQTIVDFSSRVAIQTAANLAKTGANHVLEKKKAKYHKAPAHHEYEYEGKKKAYKAYK